MVARIARVNPIMGADYDVSRQFNSQGSYEKAKEQKTFSEILKQTMNKANRRTEAAPIADAYRLEIGQGHNTHSLSYQRTSNLLGLGNGGLFG